MTQEYPERAFVTVRPLALVGELDRIERAE